MHVQPTTSPIRVLLVDDDVTSRYLLAEALEQAGMVVTEVDGGQQALAWVAAEGLPEIVLLDVMMPGIDGFETCTRLRAHPGAEYLPILMMTGLDDRSSIEHAYRVGATDFAVKPVLASVMVHRIRYMVRAGEATRALLHSEQRLAAAQRMARIGDWEWLPEVGRIRWSARALEILDCADPTGDCGLETLIERVPFDERGEVAAWFATLEQGDQDAELRHRVFTRDGRVRHLRQFVEPSHPEGQEGACCYGAVQDITALQEAQAHIHRLAFFDSLTGLPNRVLFQQRLEQVLGLMRMRRHACALVFLDLDNFKQINDTLGHHIGDRLLQTIATRLAASLAAAWPTRCEVDPDGHQCLARLGGDEFALLLPDVGGVRGAIRVVRQLHHDLSESLDLDGTTVVVTPSIGITLFPQDAQNAADLLRNGDLAMYQAKRAGKNTYRLFDARMTETMRQRMRIETALRQALANDQFSLHYQPQVDLGSGELSGVEALLRWHHPELGTVSPQVFVPVAEESGLILQIGDWVLREACLQLARWRAAGVFIPRVAVNVSANQFARPGFPERVAQVLRENALDPGSLELELTETVLMNQAREAVTTLRALKTIGVHLAIDDFGTGYSSLSYLRRFPIDRLKIDKSFLVDIERDRDNAAIAQAVIAMAETMGLEVTAEGVERDSQLELLRVHRCDEVQGFLFSRPIVPEAIPDFCQALRAITRARDEERG
ncbi:putative bifunctional diguanylate cyclase/phosphodiesterase [Marichromatium bheemlicum]|uniref:EAL domain-containing protein n=1 Tax=Marichromatium bheemlicum TaxID=365339 RepID=A0ABX1I6K2_9GAMM|nr:EAL domain-containing protein [Marichromatium bheemlicum]NKN31857.1 EAL domain-containing protein [Marichromatium bheemlicum]